MSAVTYADDATKAEILAVEERRQAALLAVDLGTLADLYDDTIVHVHAPGLTHDKTQFLNHVATRQAYLATTREDVTVRLVGDVAIMTGRLMNRLRSPDGGERVGGIVTQVLRRCEDGQWRFLSFQMTPDGDHVWPALPGEPGATTVPEPEEPQ